MLSGFVDEVCGTVARLCAYVMTLALIAVGGIVLWHQLPDATAIGALGAGRLGRGHALGAGVCRQPIYFPRKNRGLFKSPGIPRAAARTSSTGAAPTANRSPNSNYIARATSIRPSPRSPKIAAPHDPDGALALEAAGIIEASSAR